MGAITVRTPDGIIIDQDAAHRNRLRIKARKRRIQRNFLGLAKDLRECHEKQYYLVYGHPSIESYLADPDIDISRSLFYRLTRIDRVFVQGLSCPPGGLLEAGHAKLDKIAPFVNERNKDELIATARQLSRSDLESYLTDRYRDGVPPPMGKSYSNNGREQQGARPVEVIIIDSSERIYDIDEDDEGRFVWCPHCGGRVALPSAIVTGEVKR